MFIRVLPLIALALGCGIAPAVIIHNEVEPNDSWAAANLIAAHAGVFSFVGSRVENASADYFRFPVLAGDTLTATVCCSGDPMLALFDPSGSMVAYNDDWNGLMPYLSYTIPATGMWTIAVTGYPDFGFSGGGSSGWTYTATITMQHAASSEIPEPGTWGLLAAGLAGILALRRVRR